jgi:hypothetical protein
MGFNIIFCVTVQCDNATVESSVEADVLNITLYNEGHSFLLEGESTPGT